MTAVFDEVRRSASGALPALGRETGDDDALARAFLGTLAEPGDGVLGALVEAAGARHAAELLADRVDAAHLARALEAGGVRVESAALHAALRRWSPRIDPSAFARAIHQAVRVSARLIVPGDPEWPDPVADLGVHAPLALWVRGDAGLLAAGDQAIALVGARAATGYGEHVAVESAAGLVDRGFAIVSGGAYGIDGMAHRSALRSDGATIAYLAGGVDRFYPLGHESLLSRIVERGAVVSELPCGEPPTKWRFLQRNRLIAASTAATIVLEAGHRSGSINTAGHAAHLGRPLGAVPGPVTSPASAGCHRLLREYGAVCVVDAEQMAELARGELPEAVRFGPRGAASAAPRRSGEDPPGVWSSPDGVRVRDALSARAPRSVEEVARRAGLDPRSAMSVLGSLEAEGRALRHAAGWVSPARTGR
ncbi:DNA-processing protein DprA [Agromyces sp. G08B096]|uniref:DNA-processing protein DprA n=1 Tax=Agromyces sp. G08B096 TaxID=3156399 RepID=A0AAU7WD69_9MICO